ncbi:hypothetical protein RB597_005557 [Gaeumannomyces tritici]
MPSFTYLLTLLAATAAVASPAPVPNDDYTLQARAGQSYVCKAGDKNDGVEYGVIGQDRAIGYFREARTSTGTGSGYPKPFDNKGNVMKFPSGCGSNVWELPVLNKGKRYDYKAKKDGNSPGPMRVYYTKDLKFCAIGAKLNPNGSGNPHNCVLKK